MADKQNPAPQEPVKQAAVSPALAPAPEDARAPRFPEGEEAVSEYERRKARAEQVEKAKWDAAARGEDPKAAQDKAVAETRDKGRAPENR